MIRLTWKITALESGVLRRDKVRGDKSRMSSIDVMASGFESHPRYVVEEGKFMGSVLNMVVVHKPVRAVLVPTREVFV